MGHDDGNPASSTTPRSSTSSARGRCSRRPRSMNGDDRVVTIAEHAAPGALRQGPAGAPRPHVRRRPGARRRARAGRQGHAPRGRQPGADRLAARASRARCTWVTSVCTGALLLHEAGLATGKRVTTHWAFVETLRGARRRHRASSARATCATATSSPRPASRPASTWRSGWSASCTVREFARGVQRYIEYDPAPPYAASVWA